MNGGRYFQGQFVPVLVLAKEAVNLPTYAPVMTIYRGVTKIFSAAMPVANLNDGLFVLEKQMDATFTAGHYAAHISYVLDGSPRVAIFYFEVVGGTDGAAGAVVSMAFYDRPHAKFLVQRLDSNIRRLVKNPRGS